MIEFTQLGKFSLLQHMQEGENGKNGKSLLETMQVCLLYAGITA